jgi:hypothetical protein
MVFLSTRHKLPWCSIKPPRRISFADSFDIVINYELLGRDYWGMLASVTSYNAGLFDLENQFASDF